MFAYKTNSPQYLDYVASVMTRQQIKADPQLCVFLENEYIKDNMELAIRWNEAKNGSYQEKYDFAQYLLCNGPQVDADTILHYRQKAFSDPAVMEIAYSYLSNPETLIQIRQNKYKKPADDCFTNPCFYLGPFSAMVAAPGDSRMTKTINNMVGSAIEWCRKAMKDEVQAERKASIDPNSAATAASVNTATGNSTTQASAPQGTTDTVQPAQANVGDATGTKLPERPAGTPSITRPCFQGVVPPAIEKGFYELVGAIWEDNKSFYQSFSKNRLKKGLIEAPSGDWMGQSAQEFMELMTYANAKRYMGDCSRMWSQVRGLKLFSSQNTFGPMTPDQKVGNVNADGMYTKLYGKSNPSAADVWSRLRESNNQAQEIRQAQAAGSSTPTPTTGKPKGTPTATSVQGDATTGLSGSNT